MVTTFQAPPDNNTLKSRPPARTTYQPRPNANTLANKRHKQRVPAVDTTWNPYKKDWVAKSTASKPAEAEAFSTPGVEGQDPLDPILPPELPETPKPKRRRSRKQKSRHIRQNDKKIYIQDVLASGHKNERCARKNTWNLKLPFYEFKTYFSASFILSTY